MSKSKQSKSNGFKIDLGALGIELPDDIRETIENTSTEALRRRLPFFNQEQFRTEDADTRESKGHIVRLIDWQDGIESKKKGGNKVYEKIDVEMVEPDMTFVPKGREDEVAPGTRFTILMQRGDEANDNRAEKVRAGMINAVAACVAGKILRGQEALQVAGQAIAALRQGKLDDETQPLLMRAHVRYSRNGGKSMKVVDVHPDKVGDLGEIIKVQPGDPNRSQYGTYFFNVQLDIAE